MLLFCLFLLLALSSTVQCSSKCVESSPYFSCQGATVIVIDGTSHMHSFSEINKEISYIENHLVPRLGLDKHFEVAFMLTGAFDAEKWDRKYANFYKEACSQLQSLDDLARKKALEKESLKKIMQRITEHYDFRHPVILFSKADDEDEISDAAEYARKYVRNDITVVVLSGKAHKWRNFPAVSVFAVEVDNLDSSKRLDYCIAQRTCSISDESPNPIESKDYSAWHHSQAMPKRRHWSQTDDFLRNREALVLPCLFLCDPNGEADKTTRNTLNSSTSNKSSTKSTTTHVLTSTPQPPEKPGIQNLTVPTAAALVSAKGCICNYSTSWNDVMFVFESTEAMTEPGLQEMLAHVQANLYRFNIQPYTSAEQFSTRIGIVVYGMTSNLYAPLGSLTHDEFLSIDTLPYYGDTIPNLESALRMASMQFQAVGDRLNARNVIVLMAASYSLIHSAGAEYAAAQVASQFKEDNGVLVVYNYVETHGFPEPKLGDIASPGYFMSNLDDKEGDGIKRALCDANCFCQLGYEAFETDTDRSFPKGGCYSAKQTQTIYQLASNRCKNENGCVAMTKSPNESAFLAQRFSTGGSFWIGLKWDQLQQTYIWADGTPLTDSNQPWVSSSPHQTDIDCVRVVAQGADLLWAPVDCRQEYIYACEVDPCDSQTYCTQNV